MLADTSQASMQVHQGAPSASMQKAFHGAGLQGAPRPKEAMPSPLCRVSECATLQQCYDELAEKHPRTKFLKIYSTDCIPNYPDRNLPTTLIYKDTKCIQHLIGMGAFGGPKVNPERESAEGQAWCAMLCLSLLLLFILLCGAFSRPWVPASLPQSSFHCVDVQSFSYFEACCLLSCVQRPSYPRCWAHWNCHRREGLLFSD